MLDLFLVFFFLRNYHTVLHSHYTNLHSHQKHKSISFSPHTLQNLLLADFLIERVRGKKARGPQMEEIVCKCQTLFFFNLSLKRQKETNYKSQIIFSLLYAKLKEGFF